MTSPSPVAASRARHHFSVDVEEFYHGTAFEPYVPRSRWPDFARRAPAVMDRLLEFLDARAARGTFFVVGELAEQEPEMVRRCAAAGHEIAAHSWDHRLVPAQAPAAFRDSVRRNRALLEDLTGTAVVGFRAPSFSIVPGAEWAFDVLLEEGYRYDASLFPIRGHPTYGYPDAPSDPHWIHRPGGTLAEIPATTLALGGRRLPASGGAYFRFFPYGYLKFAFQQAEARGEPATFYIHPWELDDAPEVDVPWRTRLRAFHGLDRTWSRIDRLLRDFEFQTVVETVDRMRPLHV
jgi:polysaccharide deacetylase family protein (PEP-CTERM system associated)